MKTREKSKKIFKIQKIEPGYKFYSFDGYLNHVIDIVYDKDIPLVVFKCWLKHKGYNGYYCKELAFILHEIYLLNDLSKEEGIKLFELNNIDPAYFIH